MSNNDSDSFRDMNGKEKIVTVLAIALLIIFAVGFVIGLYFFGIAGVFQLLGVQYTSIWALVIFVVSYFLLGIIAELFFKVFYKLTVRKITGKAQRFFIRIGFESTSNWLVLFTVDEFMNSITISFQTELIIALLLGVLECVLDKEDDKKEMEKMEGYADQ
ncbi:Regulatory protein YrvL [Gracilibacillus ureilyticus]|uniref:Regulatory protein YrvL n=1 Tax=Gracilibacillus ureilyticus TaxID=531814 RepID=A0A1H9V8J4_9BACI|nr:regulatory YrvL family protein [Gracilibacillus ureilyticus]SES18005.1 Regulatory protein YrvL [Gracilibacillus ureilyticus]